MTEDHEAAEVAKGLTKAQRDELFDMQSEPLIITRTLVCWALKRKGLCTGVADSPRYCSGNFSITPLGLRVRAHLQGETA